MALNRRGEERKPDVPHEDQPPYQSPDWIAFDFAEGIETGIYRSEDWSTPYHWNPHGKWDGFNLGDRDERLGGIGGRFATDQDDLSIPAGQLAIPGVTLSYGDRFFYDESFGIPGHGNQRRGEDGLEIYSERMIVTPGQEVEPVTAPKGWTGVGDWQDEHFFSHKLATTDEEYTSPGDMKKATTKRYMSGTAKVSWDPLAK